ncbi:M15 family metallopeptidase [Pendulispora rubella]|uniref:D-alanyl-D-alanine dipeptidase n=1 Tax=Pendulispora rubella TaxID=2741070 RepID=A0ABZ2KYY4_9BACT
MKQKLLAFFAPIAFVACTHAQETKSPEPSGNFVSITDIDPTIVVEARYHGGHNFLGTPVRGYNAPKCLLTRPAAQALANVQAELRPMGLALKVYDCYRPQRAVDHFVEWAKDVNDLKMKTEFYPQVDKSNLFHDGYIAEKSGHTRGSTVDITIDGLDFGTEFDLFDPRSNTADPRPNASQRANRALLKAVMDKHGFKGIKTEWWHFTLRDEPFPKTYFDAPVE